MRSGPVVVTAMLSAGLVVVAEVAHRAGTVPLARPTDGWQVVVGAALVAASAGTAIVARTRRDHMPAKALVFIVAAGIVVLLGMPYLERAVVGTDPGFLIRTFASFEWSPTARFVLFPAVREVAALIALTAALTAVLARSRLLPEPAHS